MKLQLLTADFEEHSITFIVPKKVYSKLAFAPCSLEVDITPLEDFYKQNQQIKASHDE